MGARGRTSWSTRAHPSGARAKSVQGNPARPQPRVSHRRYEFPVEFLANLIEDVVLLGQLVAAFE